MRGLPRLAAPDRFPAWVFTLARRVVYDELRRSFGEVDHRARRSQLARVPYGLTHAARARDGAGDLAGNHLILELDGRRRYVVLAHLQAGSLRIDPGDSVVADQEMATCGNSGNSTQPHVHGQAMDATDPFTAGGLPDSFSNHRARPRIGSPATVGHGIPGEAELAEPP